MASVYLARRADGQFEHTVALKVLDATRNFGELAVRFGQERQILASLNFPNIARLIDGGVTSAGQPYVVMEYVDGEPIDAYCDRFRLTIGQRIALFDLVAAAVHYAHGRLVVHRDIKPSNILVTTDGQPKLLDFGIAKLLDPATPHAAPATRAALHPMTPEYASPEQIRGTAITTATDVYALGVLLFELLAGRSPYCLRDRSVLSLGRAVLEEDPEPPSIAITRPVAGDCQSGGLDVSVSRCRSTTPAALGRQLRGDLDNIVLMALRKEPEHRYASVQHLRDDIHRYLDRRPVNATTCNLVVPDGKVPEPTCPRLRGGHQSCSRSSLRSSPGTQFRLASERDRATAQFERAEMAKDFLASVIERTSAVREAGSVDQPTMSEVLRYAQDRVETELVDQPEFQAEMGIAVGRAVHGVGDVPAALELLQKSTDQLRALGVTDTLWFGKGMSKLGTIRSDLGEFTRGEAAFRESIAVLEIASGLHQFGPAVDPGTHRAREPATARRSRGRGRKDARGHFEGSPRARGRCRAS